ncbi:MAG: hypothetical protein P1V97_38700 [Planctomycetota bacterium]|nr:hypothetical protein [Planctomycetota bacterium]
MTAHTNNFTYLNWEIIEQLQYNSHSESFMNIIRRAQVPGGWLVHSYRELSCRAEQITPTDKPNQIALGVGEGTGLSFIPDPQFAWKLAPLPSPDLEKSAEKKIPKSTKDTKMTPTVDLEEALGSV